MSLVQDVYVSMDMGRKAPRYFQAYCFPTDVGDREIHGEFWITEDGRVWDRDGEGRQLLPITGVFSMWMEDEDGGWWEVELKIHEGRVVSWRRVEGAVP